MKMSRSVSYAIEAIRQLAESPTEAPIACHTLAEAGHMPPRFLLSVLGDLVKSKLLNSIRGSEGGYSLARDVEDISLLEVIEAVGGTVELELPVPSYSVPVDAALKEAIKGVNINLRQELAAIKMAQLIPIPQINERAGTVTIGPSSSGTVHEESDQGALLKARTDQGYSPTSEAGQLQP